MRTILRYENGLRVEAVLLSANNWNMRVAVEDQGDTTELVRVDDCWQTEAGARVEVEALMMLPGTETLPHSIEVRPRTIAAGSSFGGY